MNKNLDEKGNSLNTEVEDVQDLADDATDEEKAEHLVKLQNLNKQLFARAKKAEGFELKDGKWVKPVKSDDKTDTEDPKATTDTSKNLSSLDAMVLMRNNIEDEDIEEVVEYANFKKISIADALKSPVLKQVLADRIEARNVAEGTNTGGGRRGTANVSDEALLENARNGKYPESDADLARLTKLRRTKK